MIDQVRRRSRQRALSTSALVAVAVLLAGCGAQSPTASANPAASSASSTAAASLRPSSATRGGTLRVVIPATADTDGFGEDRPVFLDPQLDSDGWAAELWRCCLVRTLLSHNGLSTEEGGSRLEPDVAADLPEVSSDGLTWTFHLKTGLRYAPPLQDIEITAQDFIRGFNRAVSPRLDLNEAWGATFLPSIDGVWDYMAGKAPSISGLEAPDDHTLVIRLAHPTSGPADRGFAPSLAIAAAMPLPADPAHPAAPFGIADGADAGFGRFLVSTGPYMLEGADKLDFSVPAKERQAPGGITPTKLTLVRNPSWGPGSDSLRAAYPDRIEISLVDSVDEGVTAIETGTADLLWPAITPIPPDVVDVLGQDTSRTRVHVDTAANVRAVILNLAIPPFDDIHVRKALNYAIDKQHLVDIQGGPVAFGVIGHLESDALEDNLLVDYDPYASPGARGDIEAARTEMSKSKYDTNGDGRCDAPACADIRTVTRPQFAAVAAAIASNFEPLGIHLSVEALKPDAFSATIWDVRSRLPAIITVGLRHILIDPAYELGSFYGPVNYNAPPGAEPMAPWTSSSVGATPEWLTKWGYSITQTPNVDARIEACFALAGAPRFECFAAVDQYLMENVVPWVPYNQTRYAAVTSTRVVAYGFDELTQTTSLDRLALAP